VDRIVAEADHLLERGFVELNLISQDVTWYGHDRRDRANLPALLRALGRIGGKFWIRLLYGHPSHVTDKLLDAIGEVPQVVLYLDLPIQHSDAQLLRAMGRGRTVRDVRGLGPRIRAVLPDVVLRTTCLVGFPGETEAQFRHLVDYVRRTEFDHLGVFVFSPEEGTRAVRMHGQVDREVAETRRAELMQVQKDIADRKAASLVGTEAEVLLERPQSGDGRLWIGRSARQAPEVDGEVVISGTRNAKPGTFIHVRYTGQHDYDMKALATHARP
jgi:ribosomal protein S12 methylthiotransferase